MRDDARSSCRPTGPGWIREVADREADENERGWGPGGGMAGLQCGYGWIARSPRASTRPAAPARVGAGALARQTL